jgi:hypothetical protein
MGCGSKYHLVVDSVLYKGHDGKKYFLPVKENDPRYDEYSTYVKRALSYLGYERVDTQDRADIDVILEYRESKETAIMAREGPAYTDRYLKFNTMEIEITAQNRLNNPIWKTTVTSTRKNAMLRTSFPIMLGGALKLIATNNTRRVNVYSRSSNVEYIQGIVPDPD